MSGLPAVGPLYTKLLERSGRNKEVPSAMEMLGKVSTTSHYKLSLHLARSQAGAQGTKLLQHLTAAGVLDNADDITSYDFLCSDASLPGVSFNSTQEAGSRQGLIESFPHYRVFPPFEVTFYVDTEFKIIRLFEEWLNFINPLYSNTIKAPASPRGSGNYATRTEIYRLQYPDEYKRIISISKFEKNLRVGNTNVVRSNPAVTYRMIDAYPEQVNSIPVTYEGSTITKTTVRFLYTRYVMEFNPGNENDILQI